MPVFLAIHVLPSVPEDFFALPPDLSYYTHFWALVAGPRPDFSQKRAARELLVPRPCIIETHELFQFWRCDQSIEYP